MRREDRAMRVVEYGIDCPHDCDGFASYIEHDFTPEVEGRIRIDLEMVGQCSITCSRCGCTFELGEIDYLDENDSCPLDLDDEEDDEDEDEEDDGDEGGKGQESETDQPASAGEGTQADQEGKTDGP